MADVTADPGLHTERGELVAPHTGRLGVDVADIRVGARCAAVRVLHPGHATVRCMQETPSVQNSINAGFVLMTSAF